MANILSTSQIVQKFLDFYKSVQPNLNTSPGAVARDLFVDAPAVRLAELYNELLNIASAQSISQSVGEDLDNLASNYSVQRLSPGKASGNVLLTFSSLYTDIIIPAGNLVYSRNGLSYRILSGAIVSTSNEAQYRALAATYRTDLDFVGITDNYAVQVTVECTTTGISGNIPKYNIYSTSIPGISAATNAAPFSGGSSSENDGAYRSRILSVFSGSNTGTSLGYKNVVVSNPSVLDAVVIGPGDPLMTRDDTVLEYDSNGDYVLGPDGEPIILSEGTGGKVDIYAYGRRLVENLDSFIYVDKSGKNDPTQSINDFTLGQIPGDEDKTVMKRRLENIADGTLPNQPVESIVEVSGSLSGTFSPQIIDTYGNSIGNYTLLKDTGTYAGSVFGFDKLHWVRDYSIITEDVTKNTFNGQDACSYSDVLEITDLRRTILVTNENSTVSPLNRATITLNHTPIRSVNKVFNYTTGERYIITDRNPGGDTGDLNTSGQITISGKNLPSVSDILQVDYEWEYIHDIYNDIDSFTMKDNPRTAVDVIDWGYGNAIRREPVYIADGYTITTVHNISSVISVNKIVTDSLKTVSVDTSGTGLVVNNLSATVLNVVSIKRNSDGAQLYNTKIDDGSFDANSISLPSDTPAQAGDIVTVVFNATDLYTINGTTGNYKDNVIYLPAEAASYFSPSDTIEANYVANISEILPSTNLSSLPVVKSANYFITNTSSTLIGVQPTTNIYLGTYPIQNLRRTPTKLGINVSGIATGGVLNFRGTTSKLIADIVFTNVSAGLTIDLSIPIKEFLGINILSSLPSNLKLSRLISLEKVEASSGVVTSVTTTYDVTGYALYDNSLALDESIADTSLGVTEVKLPITTTNSGDVPLVGDTFRASFYVIYTNDSESVSFSTNGTLFTEKSFVYLNTLSVSSGFKSTSSMVGGVSLFALSQPQTTSRYRTQYTYTAPKAGERITVRFNSNALINDLTFTIEDKRPITADVIVKSAGSILIDVIASITVLPEYTETAYIVAQNVGDKIANYINALTLGAVLHPSDVINVAYQVSGLDSITITRFNESGKTGNVAAISALRIEYMQANNITINT